VSEAEWVPSHRGLRPLDGRLAAAVAALAAALTSAVVYRDVLGSYFWNDDFAWLFVLHEHGLGEFLFTPMGGHSLVARNAVIAALDALVGLDPRPWFASVLLTHALNVALLARLIWLLTGSAGLAGMGALAWGICPAASETLGWYAVYGQVAATTCLLAAFNRVARLARTGSPPAPRDLALVTALLVLSSLFFGTAIAVAIAWPVVIALLVPGSVGNAPRFARVFAVPAIVVGLYAVLQLVGVRLFEAGGDPSRVLAWLGERYWAAALALAHLVRVGTTWLLLGAWWAPAAQSDASSWWVLAVALVGWVTAAWRASGRLRGALGASLLLALAIYAAIAIARGPSAGPIFQRTSAQVGGTLRYHYVPQAFLAVATCVALSLLGRRRELAAGGAWVLLLLGGQLRYGVEVDLHEPTRRRVTMAIEGFRREIAAAPVGTTVRLQNGPLAMGWLPNSKETPPGLAALFAIVHPTNVVDGRAVQFVEPREPVRERARLREGRTWTLLIAPP